MLRRIVVVGPVFPYRAGISYCTTALAAELASGADVEILSFSRQFPRRFYPGGDDRDPSLENRRPPAARFALDVLSPWSWIREGLRLRRNPPDAIVLTWWIWVWALPYRVMLAFAGRGPRVVVQCHNASDKEPAWWKSLLNRWLLSRGDEIVVHASSEAAALRTSLGESARITTTYLPVHELGGPVMTRADGRRALGLEQDGRYALFFGHVRPFKGLDLALAAWKDLTCGATLLVAGEVWWNDAERYRDQVAELGIAANVRLDFRYIPDAEVAAWFAASDVVLLPYRNEAQSGVALTAFHFGRPVIASAVGGVPEVVEDGREGLLVPPERADELAAAVDRFFLREDRGAMEAAALAAAQKYSWAGYGSVIRAATDAAVDWTSE